MCINAMRMKSVHACSCLVGVRDAKDILRVLIENRPHLSHLLLPSPRNAPFLVDDGLGETTDPLKCRPHQLKVVILRSWKDSKHVCQFVAIKA